MSVTGREDGEPMQIGAPVADVIAGMFAAYSIVSALYARKSTGCGRYIDISMQDAMLAVLGPRMGEALQARTNPQRHGNENPMRVPANTYLTRDGHYIAIIVQNDNHWQPFCRAIDRMDLFADECYRTMKQRVEHRKEIDAIVAGEFARRDAREWESRLEGNRVPYARVNTYLEAVADPQVVHRELIREVHHPASGPIRIVGPPWKMSEQLDRLAPPPLLGQHTADVLRDWLGWDEASALAVQMRHEKERAALKATQEETAR
jgi:crotonobetainyl-CoA:carnitine CoA-transferase CaiB-like acyl-CoA transferase